MNWLLVGMLVLGGVLASPIWGLEGVWGVNVEHTLVQVVAGPPGTAAQEVGTDRARAEALVSHQQSLPGRLSAEGTLRIGVDTLPSRDTRNLPAGKLSTSAAVLEGWLGWEAWPGLLTVGVGKRQVQPSSGFSHKTLNWLTREDDREGRTGAQIALFGEMWSASLFAAPQFTADSTDQAFALGRLGFSLGTVDAKVLVLQRGLENAPRSGVGLDASWGDHLTLRAEVAADARLEKPRGDLMAGFTWTTDDQTILMLEGAWDGQGKEGVTSGFARLASNLDEKLVGDVWVKAESLDKRSLTELSGWVGSGLTWTASRWSLEGTWLAAWGPSGTLAGDSALRWKVGFEAKSFW